MDLVNETPFEIGWFVTRLTPPGHDLVVVVKATFTIVPGESVTPAGEQLPITGDVVDDSHPATPLRYAMDIAPFKPRADLLVNGTAHAPAGRPVGGLQVSFQVGPVSKSLVVIGPRQWTARRRMSEPQPFTRIRIGWENAFGGAGFPPNPAGLGHQPIPGPDGKSIHPLPLVESPGQLIERPADRPTPASFSPIPETWPQRLKLFGRPDAGYFADQWPGPPGNLDLAFYNAAPRDQQAEGYLRGDETFAFENLHPTIPRLQGRLPAIAVQAFLHEKVRAHDECRQVPLVLDTFWAAPDAHQIVLVWRGHVSIPDPKPRAVRHLHVFSTPLSAAPLTTGQVGDRLQAALAARDLEEEELEPEPEPDADDATPLAEPEPDLVTAEVNDEASPPSDAASIPTPPATAAARSDTAEAGPANEAAEEEAADEPEPEMPTDDADILWTRTEVERRAAAGLPFAECDLSGLDLSGIQLAGADLRDAILENTRLVGANLEGANLAGATLGRANLRSVRASGACFHGADLAGARLDGAILAGANLDESDLSQASLRAADLVGASLVGATLEEVDISDADLTGANLAGADLAKSKLHRTILDDANLSEANLERAWGFAVRARRARLVKARAAHCTLPAADLARIQAEDSVWQGARLVLADFSGAMLDRGEFSAACLDRCTFDAASLREAVLNEATLRLSSLRRANLLASSLDATNLSGAAIIESNLFGVSLMDATLHQTHLNGSNLRRIKSRKPLP